MILSAIVAVVVAAETNPPCPSGNVGTPLTCSTVGDPLDLNYGGWTMSRIDLSFPTSTGPFEFKREFSTRVKTWETPAIGGQRAMEGMPKPFGEPSSDFVMRWWHNYLAFVEDRGGGTGTLNARQRGGRHSEWNWCDPGATPIGTVSFVNQAGHNEPLRLACTSNGFLMIEEDGTHVYFEQRVAFGTTKRWFITKIVAPNGIQHATIEYGQPLDVNGAALTSCPKPDATTWTPYIRRVVAYEGGLVFDFRYVAFSNAGKNVCALSRLVSAGGSPLLDFAYATSPVSNGGGPWGQIQSLVSVSTAPSGTMAVKELYDYSYSVAANIGTFTVRTGAGYTTHKIDVTDDVVTSMETPWELFSTITRSSSFSNVVVTITNSRVGNGSSGSFQAVTSTRQVAPAGEYHTGRLDTVTNQSCVPGSCQTGTVFDWDWTSLSTTSNRVALDGHGHRSVGVWKSPWTDGQVAKFASHKGMIGDPSTWPTDLSTPASGCVGQECEWYDYSTLPENSRRVTSEFRRSTYSPGTVYETRTAFTSTGQVASIIKQGATNNGNSTGFVGVFYKQVRSSGGNCVAGSDADGRIVEIQGPCWVSGFAATSCASSPFPLTQIDYYGATGTSTAKRISSVRRYPNSCTSQPLTTQYTAYSAAGGPQTVVAPDGSTTTNAHDALGRLTSTTRGGSTWTYGYHPSGKLAWTRNPLGEYQVACYSPYFPCIYGETGPFLRWTATAPNADGTGWTRKTDYRYDAAGNFAGTDVYDSAVSTTISRFQTTVASDAERNRVLGKNANLPADVARFDGDSLRLAYGRAYNAPPAFCLNGGSPSDKCDAFYYDSADRLQALIQTPVVGTTIQTALEYDERGNLCEIGVGGSALGCSLSENATAGYRYDDFGNLVQISLPNTGSATAKGVIELWYDAAGNLERMYTPESVTTTGRFYFTRDQLGRPTAISQVDAPPLQIPTTVSLYTFYYDTSPVPPTGCGSPSNTAGRLAAVTHPLGTTYYSYDVLGRVVNERLVKSGATSCTNQSNSLATGYSYDSNGNLSFVFYPSGRIAWFVYGTGAEVNVVKQVYATVFNGTSNVWTLIADGVKWEPDGRLKRWKPQTPGLGEAVVEFFGYDSLVSGCGSAKPTAVNVPQRFDYVWVSSSAMETGDIFKQGWRYNADQIDQINTCYLGGSAITTNYSYDRMLRLTSATGPVDKGAFEANSPSYDSRSNRTALAVDSRTIGYSYVGGFRPDQLSQQQLNVSGSLVQVNYAYDRDGRVMSRTWPPDSSGQSGDAQTFGYKTNSSAIGDSAIRRATVKGAVYEYVYDQNQRRLAKIYPWGARDSFTYSARETNAMLEDLGDNRSDGRKIFDDYIWLGGRPIAVLRGSFTSAWVRENDGLADCSRGGELSGINCGTRHVVTDYQGRTVLTMDSSKRIAGVAEYQAFGDSNTRFIGADTAHPYANSTAATLASWTQQPLGLSQSIRINFDVFDIEPTYDTVQLRTTGGTVLGSFTGYHQGRWNTGWYGVPTGFADLRFNADSINCGPTDPSCSLGPWVYTGVAARSYEYIRYQSGAAPWMTPLRLPGHYRDEETQLFENWNRYLEPGTGRYLSPEPLLRRPGYVKAKAGLGESLPTYAYANSNPIRNTDRTGLFTTNYQSEGDCATYYWAALRAQQLAGCDGSGKNNASCQCNMSISGCTSGCDVCEILAFGKGPDLYFDSSGGRDYSLPGFIGGPSTHIDPAACDWAMIEDLANSLLHEAIHHCEQKAFGWMSHRGWPFDVTPSEYCGPYDLTNQCFDSPWRLGRPLP